MLRVFYFSGYRMTVFDWQGTRLLNRVEFQPDEDGFENFTYLLKNSAPMPTRLLVDIVEEDFRREQVPHVSASDRRTVVKRLLDRHYRDEHYVHAQIIGRTKLGRKDDLVLLSALTNTGLLTPWLEVIERHHVRLAGIWSVPLLTDALLKKLGSSEEHTLVVSRQVKSSMRDSYFHDGKLLLSRQSKFDKEMWDRDDFDGVLANLERGALEIYNFLINQRILEAGAQLKVYCLLPEHQIDLANQVKHNDDRVVYEFVSLANLFHAMKVPDSDNYGADVLFSLVCAKSNPFKDHYGRKEQKTTYRSQLIDTVVTQVAEIGSLICIIAAVLLALKSMDFDFQRDNISNDTVMISRQYDQDFGHMLMQIESARGIEDAVAVIGNLSDDASQSPHRYFKTLSSVFGRPEYASIQLTAIRWQKYTEENARKLIATHKLRLESENQSDNLAIATEFYDELAEGSLRTRKSIFTLSGDLDTRGSSYRETIRKMLQLTTNLEQLPEVDEVLLLKTAVDIRDAARFTDQIGDALAPAVGQQHGRDSFRILLVLKAADSA